ncbi:MAG: helix-turn-helix domain-containing protein [Actinobacteria bacterium]|nr:helix-turn-helix domain-containing protein [Actinomycetota bacterium]
MSDNITIGSYLGAAREKRRISIERAAQETRIRASYLAQMESDNFDFLAPAYVRGFLRNYAAFLRVDPRPLVAEFDRLHGGNRVDAQQILAVNRPPKSNARKSPKRSPKQTAYKEKKKGGNWTLAAGFAAAVLAALSIVGILSPQDGTEGGRRPGDVASDSGPEGATVSNPEADGEASDAPAQPDETQLNERPAKGALALSKGIKLTVLASKGDCWVNITSDGLEVANETLVQGSSKTVSAEDEMNLVLGNAGGIELIVNGRNIGSPGEPGEVSSVTLPRDIRSLL